MSTAEVVATGLLLVFALLVLITVVLYILPLLLNLPARLAQKKEKKVSVETTSAETVQSGIPGEILAVIMAAIRAEEEAAGVPYGNFRVVAFKKIGRK